MITILSQSGIRLVEVNEVSLVVRPGSDTCAVMVFPGPNKIAEYPTEKRGREVLDMIYKLVSAGKNTFTMPKGDTK
ncbi:MAG: hypothetical protein WBL80_06285 [Erysipelotrichaceae bacterium]